MAKRIKLNEGAQTEFVNAEVPLAAYVGGVGSGKTFAGLVKGIRYAQKYPGSVGLVCAITYRGIKDFLLPQFWGIIEGTGLLVKGDKGYLRSEMKAVFRNGSEIWFRSLDNIDKLRGLEVAWFFIDEGRNTNRESFDVLLGRLRQMGPSGEEIYPHQAWVCSTPKGFNWLYDVFHPDSRMQYEGSVFYEASTQSNERNLPSTYIPWLKVRWHGKWYEQEVEGRFVGLMAGAALPNWDRDRGVAERLEYDPTLPLYSFWDFGIGDLGVCEFCQVRYRREPIKENGVLTGEYLHIPELIFLDCIEAKDWGAKQWAEAFHDHLFMLGGGKFSPPVAASYGDPAGRQRTMVTGTSIMDALYAEGVAIAPAITRSHDLGLILLDNLMADGRVVMDAVRCERLAAACSSHHYQTDENGNRASNKPVHDWTSHYIDAARYGAVSILTLMPTRTSKPPKEPPGPGTFGYLIRQLTEKREPWLGQPQPEVDWQLPAANPEDWHEPVLGS
jgi:hypothetical protein